MSCTRLLSIHAAVVIAMSAGRLEGQTFLDPARAASATRPTPGAPSPIADQERAAVAGLESENAFAPPTPGDSDIGHQIILKRNEDAKPFSVWLDSSGYWTDNAANLKDLKLEDYFFAGGVNAAWQQRLKGRFYGDVYAGQHWYRYDEITDLDYESGEGMAGFLVLLPELANSIFHVHYYYQRITQDIGDEPIYQTHDIRAGLQKTFLINRLNSVNMSLMSSFSMDAEPEYLQRHEHSLLTAYNFKVTRKLLFQLSYRLSYYDYFNLEGREDWYHNFGVNVAWRPVENFELSAGYNYTVNESNYDVFNYESQLAGPSIALKYKF